MEIELRQRVVNEVHAAGMFSIMADTTPDESHNDQLSVVVRYVTESGKPVERLLAVNESLDKSGKGQAGEIVSATDKLGLDTAELCYQSYDFTAAMSAVLGDIGGNPKIDKMTQIKAFGLRKKMLNLDFIVTIMFMKNIMYKSKHLVEKLQKVDVNVSDAAALVEATMKVLDQIRSNDKTMTDLIEASCNFAEQLGIDPERQFSRHHHQRKVPWRLDDRTDTSAHLTHDVHISRMREQLVQFQDALKPLFSCLKPPIDASEAPSIVALFPPTHAPDPSALMTELQVLAELCPHDELTKVIETSEANKEFLV
ncbi:Zinc finger MYM-type protein 1 [Holothuria leucospilota]|uniref:Zinc finger MYM-type protein 1 n=1 Tax=Holothuria leucospilota TaxID=206669 RepID=A0A9Q1BTS4_HOLLE|nr:Zinc finger MYM-type protein 1 [Holothuria leucospilota]